MKAGKIRVVGSVYGNNDDVGRWSCLEPIVSAEGVSETVCVTKGIGKQENNKIIN